jgi:hypothetical protein
MAKTWMAAPSRLTKRVPAKTVRKAAVVADTAAVAAVAVAIAAAAEAVAAVVVTVAAAVVAVDTATEAATEAATKPEHAINSQRGVRKGALFVALSNADRARPSTIERKRVSRRDSAIHLSHMDTLPNVHASTATRCSLAAHRRHRYRICRPATVFSSAHNSTFCQKSNCNHAAGRVEREGGC